MDPKQTELEQKKEAIRDYIEKQLSSGVKPKEIYQQLVDRKVPSKLATDLINQVIARRKNQSGTDTAAVKFNERQQKIIKFIQTQLNAGKSKKDVLFLLMEKKVSKQEAVSLIRQVSPDEAPSLDASGKPATVSSELPRNTSISVSSSKKPVIELVGNQLAAGVDMKEIVDNLVDGGMPRNKAIDLVVGFDQKLSLEQAGPNTGDHANLATRGRNKMLIGIAALVGGGLFTAASYSAAGPGEEYIVFYGPMIFGVIYAVAGLIDWLRNM